MCLTEIRGQAFGTTTTSVAFSSLLRAWMDNVSTDVAPAVFEVAVRRDVTAGIAAWATALGAASNATARAAPT